MSLITLIILVLAGWGFALALQKGKGEQILFAALGAVLGVFFDMAMAGSSSHTPSDIPAPATVTASAAEPEPWQTAGIEPDGSTSEPRRRQPRDVTDEGGEAESVPHIRGPRQGGQTSPAPPGGGVDVSVEGEWAPADEFEVESAVMAALQDAGWSGFTTGSSKTLQLSGALRDLELTLGQLPTAAVSMRWEMRSDGHVLAQGGVSDLRGTGGSPDAARAAAIKRAARTIAEQIEQRVP